ncbi:type II toxin-antitoxin system RatA family toxin [Pseudomarimonas arenosa]|uniref:Type II toxin-antitoxin system RatA family toxin n=1 Tax=Pseudomarimonas arenosa TaxID=2774145 RepID=A0AAW3ZGF5_9GAMM|nr:type II toxin-antitoxin system RatA family toxin [Pseudomarimonas arenosa]MBD8524510.1 type II toxin-antitoxin system RatA family toxin [Pseudomarimonas arenosa]
MSHIERSALVRVPAECMFHLVDDVEAYPRRFNWCEGSELLSQTETERVARLDVRMAGLRMSFTTRNTVLPGERIELQLVEGPFKQLSGAWSFAALTEQACRVSLLLDFEVAGKLMGGALAAGFRSLADHLVDDFVRAARSELHPS